MDIDEIKPNFLEKNMTHADVGYIHQTNEKEQVSHISVFVSCVFAGP